MSGKQIKDTLNEYEIKTTSNQILNTYYERNGNTPVKKTKSSWWKIGSILTISSACALSVLVVLLYNKNNDNRTNIVEIQDDSNNRVAFQLLSGIELTDFYANNSSKKRYLKSASESEFPTVVDMYDKANDMVQSSYISKENMVKNVYEGQFDGVYRESYPYKMDVKCRENFIFYYDGKIEKDDEEIEMTIHGEIHQNEEVYKVIANSEKSVDETEYEISIFFDETHYVIIEQEEEINEYTYLYNIFEGNEVIYEIEFENDDGEQTLDIKKNNDFYEYKINHVQTNINNIHYCTSFAEGKMTLEYKEDIKIYTENETNQKISKNYQ